MKPRSVTVRILLFCLAILMLAAPAFAATTQLHIVKYANDGTTILDESTKTYEVLGAELTVYGDGVTHYYAQGPVFIDGPDEETEQALRWNPEENANVQEKDQGAVKGTNLKDICDLVGGMNAGETVKLKASDGLTKTFAYENVYEYSARQGPMVITWYKDGAYPDGSYSDGMKLVFFADNGVNPWGINAFGNYDWHESAAEEYWYYNWQDSEKYPTTTGLSVKYISDVLIYSDDPAPVAPVAAFIATPTTGKAPLTVRFTDQSTNDPTSWTWDFGDGNSSWSEQNPVHTYAAAGTYAVTLTATNSAGSDDEVKTGYITVSAAPVVDVLFDGTVTLTPGSTFTQTAYNSAGSSYTVEEDTPLGALHATGLTYDVSDKNYGTSGSLLL
ncbi:MAG TPA: PKD domain-containing protein, partial [Methanoregulaceae archaeon]|nr:PKD domain-containing protein [Methanoregulaceae archaeon]